MERALWDQGVELVAGVDEVGRGPLAGPVLAAAVILPVGVGIRGVDDSKKLTAEKRESLFLEIRDKALAIGVGAASSREIYRINILHKIFIRDYPSGRDIWECTPFRIWTKP